MLDKAGDIALLLWKHLNGDLSNDEKISLNEWLNRSEKNRQLLQRLENPDQLSNKFKEFYELREWFTQSIDENSMDEKFEKALPAKIVPLQPKKRPAIRWTVAASIILVIASASIFLLTNNSKSVKEGNKTTVSNFSSNEIKPGTYTAILKLAGGQEIILDSSGRGFLAKQGNASVINEGGNVKYNLQGKVSNEIIYNILETGTGQTYSLTLSDGTKVWLNAGSSLRFPAAFADDERTVEMQGEVYYEVATNPKSPFKVKISRSSEEKAEVVVFGTSFNINSYGDETAIQTTLVEGSVKVLELKGSKSNLLSPGQQARIADGSIQVINGINTDKVTAWKNETFHFEGDDLRSIMRQLSRWYGVQVTYEGNIRDRHFSGMIGRNTNLSEVLDMLRLSKIIFSVEGKNVIVRP